MTNQTRRGPHPPVVGSGRRPRGLRPPGVQRWNPRGCLRPAWLLPAALIGCAISSPAPAQPEQTGFPVITHGAKQFPEDDAIILRWEQHWKVDKDGVVHRHERKWLKFLTRRPIRAFADPRIDYVDGQDKLVIHRARTILPDRTDIAVPDYSFNTTAPDDVAGWPQYAGWQQRVVSFSGIQNNVVVDLDYEVITPAGVLPWIEADLRLQDEFPSMERIISVTVPSGVALYEMTDPISALNADVMRFESQADGLVSTRWVIRTLPGARSEPQSLPWQRRCGRLRLTTCPSPAEWFSTIIQRVDRAAQPDETIRKFAESVVEEEADPAERVRKIAKKIQDSFNFVTSVKALRSLACRPAAEVFRANYGNRLESAALLTAAIRALGLNGSLTVGVDADHWNPKDEIAPGERALAGVVLSVDTSDGRLHVHPQHGVFENPGSWGRHWLVGVNKDGSLEKQYVYARGEDKPGTIEITGKIAVDTEGRASGELRFRLTGGFFDPARLDTSEAQKALVDSLVGKVLWDFDVPGHSIVMLSQKSFKATANVASKDELKEIDGDHWLRLGSGPAFLEEVPMPLAASERRTDLQLAGAFRERIDLTIELPEAWRTTIVPGSLEPIRGSWGQAAQQVGVNGQKIRFVRSISVNKDLLTPKEFNEVRQAVNKLKTDHCLLLTCGKRP